MTGEKYYTIKKCFSLKLRKKRDIKKADNKQKKIRKIRERKKWGKMKTKQKMYQRNLSRQLWKEKFIQFFKPTERGDFKIKNKDKKSSIIVLFWEKLWKKRLLWRVEVWQYHAAFIFLFMATIIDGTTNCDEYKSSKVAYVTGYI